MDKSKARLFIKGIISGIIVSIILVGLAYFISSITNKTFRDSIFFEGIFSILFGLFSAWGGNPMGLSMQSLGQMNSPYMANSNLNVKVAEEKKLNGIVKDSISIGLSTVSLVLAGLVCIGILFFI